MLNARTILAAAISAAAMTSATHAQTQYSFTLVDSLVPNYDLRTTFLWDISDTGFACGETNVSDTDPNGNVGITDSGFYWTSAGQFRINISLPHGVNNHGLIVGFARTFDVDTGQYTTLPLLPGVPGTPFLFGVNDSGVAVGYQETCICSNSQGLLQIPYVWSATAGARTLAVPGAKGAGRINNAGIVVGWIGGRSPTDAYVYDLTTDQYTLIGSLFPPMPNFWTPHATADDISDNNIVTGSWLAADATTTYGYTWHVGDAAPTLLPLPPAAYQATVRPSGINSAGTVVGSIYTTAGYSRAFVYDSVHGLSDLNTLTTPPPGFVLMGAYKINEQGWIVGYGQGGGGFYKSFVLRPIPPSCPADFNGDGVAGIPDIFSMLTAWFLADPRADWNHSGASDIPDIFAFLVDWFIGCP